MTTIKHLFLAVLLCTNAIACSDLLNQEPTDRITSAKAIQNINDAHLALVGAYSEAKQYWCEYAILLGDIMTDNSFAGLGSNRLSQIQAYTFSTDNDEITSLWGTAYYTINATNALIGAIDGVGGTDQAKNEIKGAALALRAAMYMDLVKWFAPVYQSNNLGSLAVPLVLESNPLQQAKRATVAAVYQQIETDLLAAEIYLSKKDAVNDQAVRYLNKWAVKALLARFYLYTQVPEKAISYSTELIQSNKFILNNSAEDLKQMYKYDESRETIFKLAFTKGSVSASEVIGQYYHQTQGNILPKGTFVPAQSLLDLYGSFGVANAGKPAESDYRFRQGVHFKRVLTADKWTASLVYKYPGNPMFVLDHKDANMPKLIRYAEIYLIRAEAYAVLGKFTEALSDYNELRKHRIQNYLPETAITGAKLKQEIFNERLRELCFEGFYWFDLKRQAKGFERKPQTSELEYISQSGSHLQVPANSHRWLLPIPNMEENANPAIIQNPGY